MNRDMFRGRGNVRNQSRGYRGCNRFAVFGENRSRGGSTSYPFITRNDERRRLKKWLVCNVVEAPEKKELEGKVFLLLADY
uniref:Uncharacterized protein n=1 Tax=Romanomermis culicivorax TaxID=13658 RepID=A0A915IXB7_ROMCU